MKPKPFSVKDAKIVGVIILIGLKYQRRHFSAAANPQFYFIRGSIPSQFVRIEINAKQRRDKRRFLHIAFVGQQQQRMMLIVEFKGFGGMRDGIFAVAYGNGGILAFDEALLLVYLKSSPPHG